MKKIDEDKLADTLIRSFAQGLIEAGTIDPRGKSTDDLHKEVFKYLDELLTNPNVRLFQIIDHTPTLLTEARKYARIEEHHISCLFYAVWFEHWLNNMISTAGRRKGLSQEELIQILREVQFRGKSTWLLRVLGLKPINDAHLKRMQNIIEMRNGFVHYKWKAIDIDDVSWEKDKEVLIELLSKVEKTVAYLQRLANRQIYYGKKRSVLPKKGKTKAIQRSVETAA
jgi:hypothetical protein